MKNKIIAILSAALLCFGGMCGITAHANYDSTAAAPAATETPKPARTISTAGAGHVVDNISDSDKFQFISVTAKDGSVFFIDKQNVNDNVYFLNKVDISDLEALAKENSAAVPAAVKASPTPQAQASPSAEPDGKTKTAPKTDKSKSGNSSIMLILIAIIGIGGLGAYYFKVYLPKKNMENAPDLEDFEFTDGEDEETENEDDTYTEDE